MSDPTISQVTTDARPCANPECDNQEVEPEQDGEHLYFECEECGYGFGWEKIEEGVRLEGNCSIGVPESVRRASSAGMEGAIAAQKPAGVVDLGLSIGRRPQE
jgi:hypothetical protein